jgi:hypothetical protein
LLTHPGRLAAAAIALLLTLTLVQATPAQAASKVTLKAPRTWTQTATLSWKKVPHASYYRVCIKSDTKVKKCSQMSGKLKRTKFSYKNLKPTAGVDWYYKVSAYSKKKKFLRQNWGSFDLKPAKVPAATVGAAGKSSFNVGWYPAANATKYEVQVATDPAFTQNSIRYAAGSATSYWAHGLIADATYFVRVRGFNDAQDGLWSPVTSHTVTPVFGGIRVATYNICGEDKCRDSDSKKGWIDPWDTRKPRVVARLLESGADIIATQENAIKSKVALTGYAISINKSAKTTYYRPSLFDVQATGWITLNTPRAKFATWTRFRQKATGLEFLFVDAHLTSGSGATYDAWRAEETEILKAGVARANTSNLTVIWAGDWNSNSARATDSPAIALEQIGALDATGLTEVRTNASYNSAISTYPTPRIKDDHVDKVFVETATTSVTAWQQFVDLDETGLLYSTALPTDHHLIAVNLDFTAR